MSTKTQTPAAQAPAARKLLEAAQAKLDAATNEAAMAKSAFMDVAVALERKVPNVTDVDVAKARANHDRARERVEVMQATFDAAKRDLEKAEAADSETQEARDWAEAESIGAELTALHKEIREKISDLDGVCLKYVVLGERLAQVSPAPGLRRKGELNATHWAGANVGARLKALLSTGHRFALGPLPDEAVRGAATDRRLLAAGEFEVRGGKLLREEQGWIALFSQRNYRPPEVLRAVDAAADERPEFTPPTGLSGRAGGRPATARGL